MNKLFALATLLVLVSLSAFPVAAAPKSLEVTIEVDTLFDENGSYPSPFIAFGPAVDAGLICGSGMVYDVRAVIAGPPDAARLNFHMIKQFVCDDGSGDFYLNLMAHVIFDPYKDVGQWNSMKGTGAYTDLIGRGTLEAFPTSTGVYDIYTGWVNG